ncbi:hypothetical protein pb186bvf_006752 [Paramecium bursaria]
MFTWFAKKTQNESDKHQYFDEILLHEHSGSQSQYCQGLRYKTDFTIEDIEVGYMNKYYKIHAFVGGDASKPVAFMFHGYAASEAQYFKMYKKLLKAFYVISIDLPGMGQSSKENISLNNRDEAINFLSGTIINAMKQFPGKKTLIGHSFGGYIAALVAQRCPDQIERIYFLSPAGATQYNKQQLQEIQDFSDEVWHKKKLAKILQSWWQSQETLNDFYRRWWSPFLIKQFLRFRINLKGQELHLYQKYLFNYLELPVGSEKSIFMMFFLSKVRLSTDYSIEQIIRQSKELQSIPIMFYYGDTDWMDQIGPQRLAQEFGNIKLRIIKNTDHQLVFFNPDDTVSQIIEDLIV